MEKKKRIYIADDEINMRRIVKDFLVRDGYIVETFENGSLLLDKFKKKPADLVMLDVMMPGANGYAVCKEIRKTSTVPIIMLSARDSDLDYATALNLGSDDYFTKPFSMIELSMRVNSIFRRIEYSKQ